MYMCTYVFSVIASILVLVIICISYYIGIVVYKHYDTFKLKLLLDKPFHESELHVHYNAYCMGLHYCVHVKICGDFNLAVEQAFQGLPIECMPFVLCMDYLP